MPGSLDRSNCILAILYMVLVHLLKHLAELAIEDESSESSSHKPSSSQSSLYPVILKLHYLTLSVKSEGFDHAAVISVVRRDGQIREEKLGLF